MALADASITSPFLEKFGRSSRDTGLVSERSNAHHGDAAAAHAEFQPHPPEDRVGPQDSAAVEIHRPQERARNRRRIVFDDSLPIPAERGFGDCRVLVYFESAALLVFNSIAVLSWHFQSL